ncbi:MAG: hypothetical protein RIT45_513 [Pseudomonadota bacterium]|jgi:ABC-2 type transport system ATP-binding protein
MQMAIAARGVKKRYGTVQALAGLDLEVPRGVIFGLVGPNGAGKTTFIKTLLGIARPDEGDVRVLQGSPEDVAVRARIGYLPENLQIPRHLDAQGFLRSVARMRGLPPEHVDAAIERTLTATGLERAAWRRAAGGWSKGMRQRAGLAAALLGDPELLVLDEPTDGIDPLGRAAIRDVVREAAAAGATVFLNSHLLAETEQICDRVAIMRAGQVVLEGPLERLRATDRVRVVLVAGTSTEATATAAGMQADPDRHRPGLLAFTLPSADPSSVSAVLQQVLNAGEQVVEVMRPMRALEDVMREAVR